MPRPTNPFTKVAKRVASLQVIAAKLNAEIAALADLVAIESKKPSKATLKPTSSAKGSKRESSKAEAKKSAKPKSKNHNTVPASKANAKPVASKPRSSKAKTEQPAKIDNISRLNDEPIYPVQEKSSKLKKERGEPNLLSMLYADPERVTSPKKRGKK